VKRVMLAAGALVLGACVKPVPPGEAVVPRVILPVATGSGVSTSHLGCSSGSCAFAPPPEAVDIPHEKILELMGEVAREPVGTESLALDTLLYHDGEIGEMIAKGETGALPVAWIGYLQEQIARRVALFSLRVVDESGAIRAQILEEPMTLGVKRHMEIADSNLHQDMNANGTMVRVGRDHLWYRM
jgi:hypothetical protein